MLLLKVVLVAFFPVEASGPSEEEGSPRSSRCCSLKSQSNDDSRESDILLRGRRRALSMLVGEVATVQEEAGECILPSPS